MEYMWQSSFGRQTLVHISAKKASFTPRVFFISCQSIRVQANTLGGSNAATTVFKDQK